MAIPTLDLFREFQVLRDDITKAIENVCQSSQFIRGEEVRSFEDEISQYLGGGYAIGCASGTDALQLALMAFNIGPGDEVITTPFTFVATAEVIKLLGATPVFVDIDKDTYNIDPQYIVDAITKKTKAIIPVHLFGQCAQMDKIKDIANGYGLFIVEDSAQSMGATYQGKMSGTIGDIGCFSFFPSKNLGCYGDGGLVFTKDQKLSEKIRTISNHGSRTKYHYDCVGINSRLDSIQAAILRVKLKYLDEWNINRRKAATFYTNLLSDTVKTPVELAGNKHVYHQYTIETNNREQMIARFKNANIGCAIYYPSLLTDFPIYSDGKLHPIARSVCKKVLSLPMGPFLTESEIKRICEAVV
ncbi:hypothetical protein LCGC14_0769050 [marine sediment metagenome]|uniref:Transcriptional regulator n=1 Tax=marine sediment metagenome TaxID=412755 RepID=A0A0F9PZ03_9ZZZZ